ncbi:hypothetical protein NDU88_001151 [Pleurodeles waltl]|uniref:Uncharacterized protein n=1 Tax=Pleurodeles waltl TaxID=8319 RepID=A0AAV7R7R6_PLEWA|nr:hypothetical protein NDU88_001151 [Pleurodeles waltl]
MGHKCQKCSGDKHFASVCMGRHIKAKRRRLAHSRSTESRHTQHVEAYNRSSSIDSDAASTHGANERLYLMLDAPACKLTPEHIQLVDKRQRKKIAMVELQTTETPSIAQEYLNFVLTHNTPDAITMETMAQETMMDATLQAVKTIMQQQR